MLVALADHADGGEQIGVGPDARLEREPASQDDVELRRLAVDRRQQHDEVLPREDGAHGPLPRAHRVERGAIVGRKLADEEVAASLDERAIYLDALAIHGDVVRQRIADAGVQAEHAG